MSFHTLPDELERIDYIGSRVEADSSRWKIDCSQRMSTYLHNEMDAREGYAHYRYDICNDTGIIEKHVLIDNICITIY